MTSDRLSILLLISTLLLPLGGCASVSPDTSESRPFYQKEHLVTKHGRKTWLDHLIEFDPGGIDVDVANDYLDNPPAVIAPMPFTDHGSAQYTVDKIPFTFRNKEERDQWAWTDAQRLRRAMVGYLSQREFDIVNPIKVDAVLKKHGINNDEQLHDASVLALGRWFQCDAVLFGQVNHYEAFYFGPLAGYVVGVDTRLVSTHDGETLMRSSGSRYDVDFLPAMDPQDILINSAEALLQLRDVELARSEEEVARELVLRIPVSQKLRAQMARSAIDRAEQAEGEEAEAAPVIQQSGQAAAQANAVAQRIDPVQEPRTAAQQPSPVNQQSGAALQQSDASGAVDAVRGDLNTAPSWPGRGDHYASHSSQ